MKYIKSIRKLLQSTVNFYRCSCYLESGIYYYHSGAWKKINRECGYKLGWRPVLLNVRLRNASTNNMPLQNSLLVHVNKWNKKVVLVFNDYTISYYLDNSLIVNMVNHYDSIPYNKSRLLSVDYFKHSTTFETIHAEPLINENDRIEHLAEYICQEMVNLHRVINIVPEECLKDISDVVFCIQHGDTITRNFIWNDNKWVAIDFDKAGPKPLLYDLLRLLTACNPSSGLRWFVSGEFDACVKNSLRQLSIEYDESVKDKYLACYYLLTYKYWDTNWLDMEVIPDTYSLTSNAIKNNPLEKAEQ